MVCPFPSARDTSHLSYTYVFFRGFYDSLLIASTLSISFKVFAKSNSAYFQVDPKINYPQFFSGYFIFFISSSQDFPISFLKQKVGTALQDIGLQKKVCI